jgi:hypothetical protein
VRRFSLFAFLIIVTSFFGSACVKRISIAEKLPVRAELSLDQLVNRINDYAEVKTYFSQGNLTVVNYFTSDNAKADQYPAATGLVWLQRPQNIRMKVTFLNADVADMTTDGEKFRVAIYRPDDKRRFIYGSNLKRFDRLDVREFKDSKDPRIEQAGGLVNMRPQHITEAFLIKPILNDDKTGTFIEQVKLEENLLEPGKKKRLVERTYYVLYVLERNSEGKLQLRHKFWFDRTQENTPLVRQQIFENGGGKLTAEVFYANWIQNEGTNIRWPLDITIDRREDGYRLRLQIEKDSLEINGGMSDATFRLENTKGLKELNVDEDRDAKAGQQLRAAPSENANRRRLLN